MTKQPFYGFIILIMHIRIKLYLFLHINYISIISTLLFYITISQTHQHGIMDLIVLDRTHLW